MKRLLTATLLALTSFVLHAQDNSTVTDWTGINLSVTDTHILAAYEVFTRGSADLAPAAAALCSNPGADTLARAQQAFHQSMDGWQGVQHIQFGPVTYFNWNFRLQYWPDDKNTGSRQLDALIASRDESKLVAENFERESVGIQGFPALERLLFETDSLALLQQDAYRCLVLQAIAANIGTIADGISVRWRDEFRATIENADSREYFESAEDATVELFKALVESLERDREQKLTPVLGDSMARARERNAESWRSQRSLRNLKINIMALADMFNGSPSALAAALQAQDVAAISAAFEALDTSLAAFPDAFAPLLADESGYARLRQLESDFYDLYELLEAALKNTDLYLGFNSLDGD